MSSTSKRIRLSPRELELARWCVAVTLKILADLQLQPVEDLKALDIRLKDPGAGGQTSPVRAARKRLAEGVASETL